MDERKHPKRRTHKDNPYRIYESNGRYFISFSDGQRTRHCFEIEKSLYDVFDDFELDDISQLNEWDRHMEHSQIFDETLDSRAVTKIKSLEEIVFQREEYRELYKAINALSKVQRKRLILYYFCGWKYEKIAKIDNCSIHSVHMAIERAKEKVKKFLI